MVKGPPHWENIFWLTVAHVMALAAIPFFTWSGFFLCMGILFALSSLAVNLTYHRLLTHRSFKVPQWFEYTLCTLAAMSGQGPMMLWVSEHRLHHRYTDLDKDPHTPHHGFFHSHIGHLLYHKEFEDQEALWTKYVPDLTAHKYYWFLHKHYVWFVLLPAIPFYYWGG